MKSFMKSAALAGMALVAAAVAQEAPEMVPEVVPQVTVTSDDMSSTRGLFFAGGRNDVTPLPSLNIANIAGTWYEIGASLYPKLTYQLGCSCTSATYTPVNPPPRINIVNRCERSSFGKWFPSLGNEATGVFWPTGTVTGPLLSPAEGVVKMTNANVPPPANARPNFLFVYREAGAGFDPKYLIVVSPHHYFNNVWILSRERQVSNAKFQELKDAAIEAGVNAAEMKWPFFSATRQTDCGNNGREASELSEAEPTAAVVADETPVADDDVTAGSIVEAEPMEILEVADENQLMGPLEPTFEQVPVMEEVIYEEAVIG